MSNLEFIIILPSYIYLPDGEYEVTLLNESFKVLLNNIRWTIERMNSYGEMAQSLIVTEAEVINPESLKLKSKYDDLFNRIFPKENSEDSFNYFPIKMFSALSLNYDIDDTEFPENREEQNNYVINIIKEVILPVINKFLEAYRFYVTEENPTIEIFRINNLENITFYDILEKNSFINLIREDNSKIDFKSRIISFRFGADFPFFAPTFDSLKKFREKLRRPRNSNFEILWGEIKHSVFKMDWRKAIILADSFIELLKNELNKKKKNELNSKFETNPDSLTEIENLQLRVVNLLNESEERGIKFFIDTQIPLFYNEFFTAEEISCLKEIHDIRNQIIHRSRRSIPEDFEMKFNSFRGIAYKLIQEIYDENIILDRIRQLPIGITIKPISSGEWGPIKPFQYKTDFLLSQLNYNFRNFTENLINSRINEFNESSFVLNDFSKTYNVKIAEENGSLTIFLKYFSLGFLSFKNLINSLKQALLDSKVSAERLKFIIGSFIIPNPMCKRVINYLYCIFRDYIAPEVIETEFIQSIHLFPSVVEELEFHEISYDFRYLDLLNLIGIDFMRRRNYNDAEKILLKAENLSRFLGSIKQEAKAKFNLACLYSRMNQLKRSGIYLRKTKKLNPEIIINWQDDEDLRNLRDSGFEL